ncbi:MAG TPA: YjbQ family protein [Egibacteraceae bacterium]|nr:YjbQ family protein [Actinomycetota bacterium]HWB71382.1 YjbQ family protein [Egibacteraceae bacterium]
MDTTTLEIRTASSFACVDLTGDINGWLAGKDDGLCVVFAPHATAGLAVIETGSGSEQDLESVLGELLPRDDERWRHRHGSPGHGADHLLPVFAAPSLTIPVLDGGLALGTWQSVVLLDPNVDNTQRTVRLTHLAG